MAHPNIDERRNYIKRLLTLGNIDNRTARGVAKLFGTTFTTIKTDILELTRNHEQSGSPYVSATMRRRIIERDGLKCRYCGRTDAKEYIIEHIKPRDQGGLATLDNLVVACQSCNTKKRWHPEVFIKLLKPAGASGEKE